MSDLVNNNNSNIIKNDVGTYDIIIIKLCNLYIIILISPIRSIRDDSSLSIRNPIITGRSTCNIALYYYMFTASVALNCA